jgi:membrane protein
MRLLPSRLDFLISFYWPVVVVGCICFLATLYHVSVPVRTKWRFNLPGATFSLLTWVIGSYVLRWTLTSTAGESKSIFGPLAAPIAVLLWLYIVALAVLIGAGVNAAFDTVFPQNATERAREEVIARFPGPWQGKRAAEAAQEIEPQDVEPQDVDHQDVELKNVEPEAAPETRGAEVKGRASADK